MAPAEQDGNETACPFSEAVLCPACFHGSHRGSVHLRGRYPYNVARRLKALSRLTPYEYVCRIWTSEPDRLVLNPIHQMPGLNNETGACHVSIFLMDAL